MQFLLSVLWLVSRTWLFPQRLTVPFSRFSIHVHDHHYTYATRSLKRGMDAVTLSLLLDHAPRQSRWINTATHWMPTSGPAREISEIYTRGQKDAACKYTAYGGEIWMDR